MGELILRCGRCTLRITQGPEPRCSCLERDTENALRDPEAHRQWVGHLMGGPDDAIFAIQEEKA
jgi:hypothetical protein